MRLAKLSIIIPVFNEQETIVPVLERVCTVALQDGINRELIIVDDHSSDQSLERINSFLKKNTFPFSAKVIHHEKNMGKGGAVQTGIREMTGDYLIIQDADLELDPSDYRTLIDPILRNEADVVYGSRFLNSQGNDTGSGLSLFANRFLTSLSNFSFGTKLTDMETCYKLLPADGVRRIKLEELRFGFEPEITAKIARNKNYRIREVPIRYYARTEIQGKKIGWKDGFRAIYCIVKYGIMKK